jgi:hypothetical protein
MQKDSAGSDLEGAYAALGNAVLPVTAYSAKGELLSIGVTRGAKQLGCVNSIICPDTANGDAVSLAESFKSLFGLKHLPRILALVHGEEDKTAVVIHPHIAVVVVCGDGRSFACRDNPRTTCLQLVGRDPISRFVVGAIYGASAGSMWTPFGFTIGTCSTGRYGGGYYLWGNFYTPLSHPFMQLIKADMIQSLMPLQLYLLS